MIARARPPNRERAARAIRDFLDALGLDLQGELDGTPERVAAAWIDELTGGLERDPAALLETGSLDLGEGPHAIVSVGSIALSTICPHHLLPSHGFADIAYLPSRRAAGLGVIAEVAHALARRPALQETLTTDLANAVLDGLDARGALCRIELVHTCFVARGERQATSAVRTLALAGSFQGPDRELALACLGSGPR
ncbi:MAG: GTP cyclohydrolase I [Polyangiaceae bacterium]